MAIYQPSKDVLLAAVNSQNSLSIKATDIVYSTPKDIRGTEKGTTTNRNTQIKISAAATGSNWSGKKNVFYDRLLFSDLVTLIGDTLEIGGSVTHVHDAIVGLNNRYGFVFETTDLTNEEIEWEPDGLTGTVLLRAPAECIGWVGQQVFKVKKGDESLQSAVTTNVLSGLKYPNGQMGSETVSATIGEVYSYPFDFTKWRDTLLTAFQPQVLSGAPLTDMVNILKDVTAGAWLSTTASSWGLAGAEVIFVGDNDTTKYPTNAKYKYVLVLKLPATLTNIKGTLYLQFNDPEDPDEV